MAENELKPPLLGVAWDGTGYGLDGTVWGGEFFLVTEQACDRVAHLRPFRLPGGDQAIKEPRRTALGMLFEALGEDAFAKGDLAPVRACSATELASFKTMLVRQLNSPLTSSVGRLFDAVASLAGLRQRVRFEGQAAMELEFAIADCDTAEAYPLPILDSAPPSESPAGNSALRTAHSALLLDWSTLLQTLLVDLGHQVPPSIVAAKFHNALVEGIVSIARRIGQERVVLSGGCFQNRYLTERAIRRLQQEGFRPYWHQRVPPNDGGICLGQIVAALRQNV
jgi:hydrogenase maturation protein HypF